MKIWRFIIFATCASYCLCFSLLSGVSVIKINKNFEDENVKNLNEDIEKLQGKSLVILSTYAADFNAIEYGQRLKYYLPKLREKGVSNFLVVFNANPNATRAFSSILELPDEVKIYSDIKGTAGRAFGVSRGFMPDDNSTSPYIKLFGMLFGLGAYATLPAVIGGYIGNPWSKQPWIEDALYRGQKAGRWPNNAIEILKNDDGTEYIKNKFDSLPYVGSWGRRPLELATLRLQNMIGISLAKWGDLKPTEEELNSGLLTQLGGCVLLDDSKKVLYEWRDAGICHVANFEDILKKL